MAWTGSAWVMHSFSPFPVRHPGAHPGRYYYLTHELAVFSVLNSGYCVHHASPLKIHSIVKTILWKRCWKVIPLWIYDLFVASPWNKYLFIIIHGHLAYQLWGRLHFASQMVGLAGWPRCHLRCCIQLCPWDLHRLRASRDGSCPLWQSRRYTCQSQN